LFTPIIEYVPANAAFPADSPKVNCVACVDFPDNVLSDSA